MSDKARLFPHYLKAIASLQRYLELEKEDTPRASHEKATPITHDREYVISNKPSLKGGDTSRLSNDQDKGLTLKEILDAPVMQLPDGVQRVEPTTPTEALINQLKHRAVVDFEKGYSAAMAQYNG